VLASKAIAWVGLKAVPGVVNDGGRGVDRDHLAGGGAVPEGVLHRERDRVRTGNGEGVIRDRARVRGAVSEVPGVAQLASLRIVGGAGVEVDALARVGCAGSGE